jgi:uncharacterized membrane protein YebE (DUF533 family)
MSLMKTLTKVALGYAVARGVDRVSSGGGLSALLGGGGNAQVKGQHPTTEAGRQMTNAMGMGAGNPMQSMFQQLRQTGLNMPGLGAPAAKPGGGLLSSLPAGGVAAAGATAAAGAGVGALFDQFNDAADSGQSEADAALILRAMIQAAKADGHIDEQEKAAILDVVGDDATEEDIAFLKAELSAPLDPEGLAADTPDGQKLALYSASLMAIRVDTDEEAQYLDRLARALGLDEPTVNALHVQMGNPALYA